MTIQNTNKMLTPEEVASKLRIHKLTVMRLIKTGKLNAVKIGYRTIRISEESLESYLQDLETR